MMDALGMGLQAAGPMIKGIAGFRAGKANRQAAYAQAHETEIAGSQAALMVRDQARQQIGSQVAAQFANGFQGGSGSALDALSESQINATLDMLQVRREALTKGMALRAEGDQAAQQGKFALLSGVIDSGSSLYKGYKDWAAAKAGQTPPKPKPAGKTGTIAEGGY